jgi:hypothetical protein
MRTKTLLLSAVVGALSGASLMAQVYSLNAVGYINVTLPPGLSQVSDQLYATNGQANTVSPILDSQLGTSTAFINARIYKYQPATQSYVGFQVTASAQGNYPANPPYRNLSGVSPTNVTINPGEAFWFFNAQSTNLTLTFVGTVPATNSAIAGLTNALTPGLNLISSVVPVTGQLDTTLGLVPSTGDTTYIYQPASQSYQGFKWNGSGWRVLSGNASAPTNTVGGGFWYNVFAAGTTNNWVQYFGVNE